ncbi:acetylcholine receptor subunit beta-like 1 [Aplysia californica]|nr:acetylcholine receptor subunit beta-like 1 [Aplysia californica]
MTPELHKTIESVKFIYHHLKSEEEYETVLEDWKYVARVMDRLLLIIFLTVGLSGTASMFLGAPHILQYVDQDKIIDDLAEYFRLAEERYNNETAAAAVH